MKKLVVLVFSFIMILVLAIPAMASTTTYHMDDAKMNIDFPKDGYILSHDMEADDPALAYYDATLEEAITHLNDNGTALEYISKNEDSFINVVIFNEVGKFRETEDEKVVTAIFNLNQYSDEVVIEFMEDIFAEDEEISEIFWSNLEIYNLDQTTTDQQIKFVKMDAEIDSFLGKFFLQYYTTYYNGYAITIVGTNEVIDAELTDDIEQELLTVVNSIEFTETLDNPYARANLEGIDWGEAGSAALYSVAIGIFIFSLNAIIKKWMRKRNSDIETQIDSDEND